MLRVIISIIFIVTNAQAISIELPRSFGALITQDLRVMQALEVKSPNSLHQEVFGSGDYYKYFRKRVRSIQLGSCEDSLVVACVDPATNNKVNLTNNFFKLNLPTMARLMILIHEARHSERDFNFWPHIRCPSDMTDENGDQVVSTWTKAKIIGEVACDYFAEGAYGVSSMMGLAVAGSCKNCSEKFKQDAELYGRSELRRIIPEKELVRIRDAKF